MPALALVKAGISMPSHSLRLCWCNSDRGHKGSAQPRVQLRPKAAANPENGADFSEHLADFCSGIFGNGGGFFPNTERIFP